MARERSRQGHLYQRSGIWWAWFWDRNGQRVRFSTKCVDRGAAREVLRHREQLEASQAAAGLSADSTGLTVGNALYHLAEEAQSSSTGRPISDVTRSMYRTKGGHLDRLLGDVLLVSLRRDDVQRYVDARLREPISTSAGARLTSRATVKKELVTLSQALKVAADRGWCPRSLAVDCIPPLANAKSKPKVRWLTEVEFRSLLGALDTSEWFAERLPRLHDRQLAAVEMQLHQERVRDRQLFVMIGALQGAELSALERLDWRDVDLRTNTLRLPGTKTEDRDRVVPLDPEVRAALARVPEARRNGKLLRSWGRAVKDLKAAAKRAGIVDWQSVNVHCLRHTFASWLVQRGVSTFVVGRLMGHRDSKMVEEHYGHLAPQQHADAMAAMPRFETPLQAVKPLASLGIEAVEHCDTGVPAFLATHGADGAHGALRPAGREVENRAVLDEERADTRGSVSEGRRTRTFSLRIKSPRAGQPNHRRLQRVQPRHAGAVTRACPDGHQAAGPASDDHDDGRN
jgi:integrase